MSTARAENAGLRLSVVGSIQRTDLPTEQPVIANLPMEVLSYQAKSKRTTVMDTRPGRRGTPLHTIVDPEEPAGALTLLAVPRALAAMILMGAESALAVAAATVSTPEPHRTVAGLAFQLARTNVSALVVYAGVRATLDTGVVNNNNALTWTAVAAGADGDDITIAVVVPTANNAALTVTVTGAAIVVSAATSGAGAATTTGALALAAVRANSAAAALVTIAHTGASTGAGVLVAAAAAALDGGADTGTALIEGVDYEVLNALEGQVRVVPGGALGADGAPGHCWATYQAGAVAGYRIAAGQYAGIQVHIVAHGINDLMDQAGVTGAPARAEVMRALLTPKGEIDLLKPEPLKLEFEFVPLAPADGGAGFVVDFPQYG